jgi:hypothetical protein
MRNESHPSAEILRDTQRALICSLLLLLCSGGIGCNIGQKTTTLTLNPIPASIQAGTQVVFTAYIDHNNGNFEGANFTLTSNGTTCSSACGTLSGYTNVGSSGNGDTATITYTAPATPPNPNSVTVTATSIENTSSSGTGTFTITASSANSPSVTTSALPAGTVGVGYLTPPLAATGGTPPYTWTLASATNTFPASLTLNSDGSITGSPATAGTYNFNVQVTDSLSATGIAPLSITITATGTANVYFGTQSPGDVWLFVTIPSAGEFSATDQTSGFTYTGTVQVLPNGFEQTVISASNDPNFPAGSTGYGVEVPGVGAMFTLAGATDKPIALLAQGPCPAISGTATAELVNLGKSSYDSTTSESYATVTATESGSDYNFTLDSYLLAGTLRSQSGALPQGTCSNGIITIPNVPQSGGGTTTVTAAAATNGLYVIDDGPSNGGSVGSQNFVGSSGLSAALANNFLGVLFKRNSVPISTFVGFGPGSGTSISGGDYVNITTDPFSSHGTDTIIDLPTLNSNGFLQGTITDGDGTHTPFVAIVSNNGNNVFIFGITTDTSTTTPYAVILIQQ